MNSTKESPLLAPRSSTRGGIVASVLFAAFSLFPTQGVNAASGTWTGGGSDTHWSNSANWSATPAPGSSDPSAANGETATFEGGVGSLITLDGDRSIRTVNFQGGSLASFTIEAVGTAALMFNHSGSGSISINANVPSARTVTINAPIEISTPSMTISNGVLSGTTAFHIGGGISSRAESGTQTILLNGVASTTATGNNVIAGVISDGDTGGKIAVVARTRGSSAWTLSATNTFTGEFYWNQTGVLNVNADGALGRGQLILESGGVLDNTSNGNVTLTNSDIVINNNFTFTGTRDISLGAAALSLGNVGTSNFRRITVNGGNLTFGGVISNGLSGSVVVNQLTVTGNQTGSLTLNGANVHDGGVQVSNVTLNVGNARALGTGTLLFSSVGGGQIDNTSGSALTLVTNNVQTWQADFTFVGSDDLNLGTGAVAVNAPRKVTVLANKLTIGGVVNSGVNLLTKAGAGTLAFDGNNTYTGKTLIEAGTFLVNGVHADSVNGIGYGSESDGHYLVASGATLGGRGRIAGRTTSNNSNMILVESGGAIAPGSGVGTLVLDGGGISGSNSRVLRMADGARFDFELMGDGSRADQLDFWNYVEGDLILNDNVINLTLQGELVEGTYTVSLFRFYGGDGDSAINSGIFSGLTLGMVDERISGTPLLSFNSGGSTIDLTYSVHAPVIPEPKTWSLLIGGVLVAGWLRFRRQSLASRGGLL